MTPAASVSRDSRSVDVCVFGCTGFTGCRVLAELHKTLGKAGAGSRKIGIAGRDEARLSRLATQYGLAGDQVFLADVGRPESLQAVAANSRIVLNCVGPYRYFGEPVFAACCENGADYLDVTGEPEFIERMEFKYHDQASKNGCLMASAAGFDSVVADLGVLFAIQQFSLPAVPSTVESFLTVQPGKAGARGHFPTWESAVLGFGSAGSLRRLRSEARRSGRAPPRPALPGPELRPRAAPAFDPRVSAWAIPFPGSDASVVRRTQAVRAASQQPAVHYAAYFTVASRVTLLILAVINFFLKTLAVRTWGRRLLLRFPGLFSAGVFPRQGPTEQQMATTSFAMTFFARGFACGAATQDSAPSKAFLDRFSEHMSRAGRQLVAAHPIQHAESPDLEIVTRVHGPEPGYVATAILISQCAVTLLEERDLAPARGGVFTVGTLLGKTTIIERLQQAGISFDVLSLKLRQGKGVFEEFHHAETTAQRAKESAYHASEH